MRPDFVHITIIIDRSASMWTLKEQIENNLNIFISRILQSDKYIECTFVYADTEYQIQCQHQHIKENPVQVNIQPRFKTALWDAIGYTITSNGVYFESLAEENRPSKVIFIIASDGQDNQSKDFSREQICDMIHEQSTRYNWQFGLLGVDNFINKINYYPILEQLEESLI